MDKFIHFSVRWKPVMLMYFAGFTFVYLLADLIFLRTGSLSSTMMWWIFAASVLLSLTQTVMLPEDCTIAAKKKIALHVVVNYGVMMLITLGSGVLPSLSFANILIFTGIFAVAYVALFWSFSVYFYYMKRELNEGLLKFKSRQQE